MEYNTITLTHIILSFHSVPFITITNKFEKFNSPAVPAIHCGKTIFFPISFIFTMNKFQTRKVDQVMLWNTMEAKQKLHVPNVQDLFFHDSRISNVSTKMYLKIQRAGL